MDTQQIHSLFDEQKFYKKYIKKDLVRVYDQNNVAGINRIRFTCHTLTNKLIDYSDAFLLFEGVIAADNAAHQIAGGTNVTINNCAIFKNCKCSFNNNEVEHNRVPDLSTVWFNLLEYSPDHASSIATQYAFAKDNPAGAGATLRKSVINNAVVNHTRPITVVIPLKYLFQFFRRLTFPIINQLVDFEFELNDHNRSILEAGFHPCNLRMTSITLFAPEVVLPTEINAKFMKALESGKMIKTLHWDMADYPLQNQLIPAGALDFDVLLGTNLTGIRKILCMIRDDPGNQRNIQTVSDINIRNFNFEIDSKDLYNTNIRTDQEAFKLLTECFNSQGKDVNTGSLLSYPDWKEIYRLYAFDISRQEIFESDPGAIQTIRFRGTASAAGQMLVILLKSKTTQIDMSNPNNTRTV